MSKKTTESQNAMVLKYLKRGKKLTPYQALWKFDALRLGARIYDLRQLGHKIETTMIKSNSKRFAQYSL